MRADANRPPAPTIARYSGIAERYGPRCRVGALASLNAAYEAHNAIPAGIVMGNETTHPIVNERELAALKYNAAWCGGISVTSDAIQNYVSDGALALVDLVACFVVDRECHA
jgi:hypothetical protein